MRIRLEVGAPAHGGHCVARYEGRAVFVRHSLPGEVVEAVVTEGDESSRFWRADAVAVVSASPDRVESVWPQAGPGGVGGGELAHVSLPAQRQWKHQVLSEAFDRFAGVPFPGEVTGAPGDESRAGLAYRTRVSAIAGKDGRPVMRKFRSWDEVTLESMPLATPGAERALLAARHDSGLRISVAEPTDGDIAVAYEGSGSPFVTENVNTSSGPIEIRLRADSFWQVHVEAPSLLVREVEARVAGATSVLDLYAGAGLFGISLAANGKQVTMVEFDRRACDAAKQSLKRMDIAARVLAGDVRRTLRSGELSRPDVVVLDPPRSGAGSATLRALADLAPERIVYVACDPVALARDTGLLGEMGWNLTEAQAFDLFPMTHHVETIATFVRQR